MKIMRSYKITPEADRLVRLIGARLGLSNQAVFECLVRKEAAALGISAADELPKESANA